MKQLFLSNAESLTLIHVNFGLGFGNFLFDLFLSPVLSRLSNKMQDAIIVTLRISKGTTYLLSITKKKNFENSQNCDGRYAIGGLDESAFVTLIRTK